ncbi:hypothetical protein CYMTET_6515 [Cymbomonas tetramitiformis]|uniref:Apple domain-containing protein n=1 Tax=Cymbomonas tetramitiformis TaxID=36881 RepID=A0AAE0LHY6_9CHLO|nr:hypothetical protein CYMTET_6515 [Cymbomonas tetramitiformis]
MISSHNLHLALLLAAVASSVPHTNCLANWHPRSFQRRSQSEFKSVPAVAPEVVAAEMDPTCHAVANLDLDGPAVSWGSSFKKNSAAECCEACKRHKKTANQPGNCNSWVWCPEPECWSPDIWNHTYGECWLKVQQDPQNPKVNFEGAYPSEFRKEHKTAPEMVAWMAGTILGDK